MGFDQWEVGEEGYRGTLGHCEGDQFGGRARGAYVF